MSTSQQFTSAYRTAFAFFVLASAAWAASGDPPEGARESIEMADGRRVEGRLEGDSRAGFRFIPAGGGRAVSLETLNRVAFSGKGPDPSSGSVPFTARLGFGGRISGRLAVVTPDAVRLEDGPGGRPVKIARAGVLAIDQRPGEAQVIRDGFESIDASRWTVTGSAESVAEPRNSGGKSLRLPAGGASATCRLLEPLGSGRLEVAFYDTGGRAPGQRWSVELTFRGPNGSEPVQAVLGWEDETLAVLSRGGPALAVQRLARKSGWHRLVVRFGPDRTDLAVDGDELAHGDGPDGPLAEIRFATDSAGAASAPPELAAYLDDLAVLRFAEPVGRMEVDTAQDEARLITGDQIFGEIRAADADRVMFEVDGRELALSWADVSGIRLKRKSKPASLISGLWIGLDWRSAPGRDARDLNHAEGALDAVTDSAVILDIPYLGALPVPRDRVTLLTVIGRTRRLVLDSSSYHLGNRLDGELDPPQPEGSVLELPFVLSSIPPGAGSVALDVVNVIGESGNLDFSEHVKQGELRTHAFLNGRPIDDLNRHISTRNETPERIRLPLPPGLLRVGRNVLKFEQAGTKEDRSLVDNLGILGVALEFPDTGP
jgi:hypothetical protein